MPIDPASDPAAESQTTESVEVQRDDVAARAYELYVARGQGAGSAFEDWLRAEAEIGGAAQREAVSVG